MTSDRFQMHALRGLLVVSLLAAVPVASAFTNNAAEKTAASDGSLADTQAAINFIRSKAQDGWVLTVGAAGGDYTWSKQLVIDVQRDFTMQGAPGEPATHIKSNVGGGIGIFVNAGVNKVFTMRNFRLFGWNGPARLIEIDGSGICFHLTNLNVKAAYTDTAWLWIASPASAGSGDGPFGLIDHCTFEGYCGVFIRQNATSSDAHWKNDHAVTWGTNKAVFIEDCTFTGPTETAAPAAYTNDGASAGKVVVRHCILNDTSVAWHGRDSTGQQKQVWRESFLCGEVYENHWIIRRGMVAPLVMIRGGTALVHDNLLDMYPTGSIPAGVQLQMHCAGSSYAAEGCLNCKDGTPMTHPLGFPDDYPDCQQPGTPQPVRVWNNNHGHAIAGGCPPSVCSSRWCVGDSGFAYIGRDFFSSDDDSAKLADYTPYVYPHPLQGSAH